MSQAKLGVEPANCFDGAVPPTKLFRVDPIPRLIFTIKDAPARDVEDGEVNILHYQFCIRVPGGEDFFAIEGVYGGIVAAGQRELKSVFEFKRWLDAHKGLIYEAEAAHGNPRPIRDGQYSFLAHAIDKNGFASVASNVVNRTLSINSPNPPVIDVTATPDSILTE